MTKYLVRDLHASGAAEPRERIIEADSYNFDEQSGAHRFTARGNLIARLVNVNVEPAPESAE